MQVDGHRGEQSAGNYEMGQLPTKRSPPAIRLGLDETREPRAMTLLLASL
jgi:hypothetical protein